MNTLQRENNTANIHSCLFQGIKNTGLSLLCMLSFVLITPDELQARIIPLGNRINTESLISTNGLGTISGRVTGDLLPIKGAKLQLLKNDEVIATTETDADGHYSFTFLEPGYYDLKGTKEGFRTAITNTIPSKEDQETKLDFYMPKFNNKNMNRYPIVESYHASQRRK